MLQVDEERLSEALIQVSCVCIGTFTYNVAWSPIWNLYMLTGLCMKCKHILVKIQSRSYWGHLVIYIYILYIYYIYTHIYIHNTHIYIHIYIYYTYIYIYLHCYCIYKKILLSIFIVCVCFVPYICTIVIIIFFIIIMCLFYYLRAAKVVLPDTVFKKIKWYTNLFICISLCKLSLFYLN